MKKSKIKFGDYTATTSIVSQKTSGKLPKANNTSKDFSHAKVNITWHSFGIMDWGIFIRRIKLCILNYYSKIFSYINFLNNRLLIFSPLQFSLEYWRLLLATWTRVEVATCT